MVASQKAEWGDWYCTIKLSDFAVRESKKRGGWLFRLLRAFGFEDADWARKLLIAILGGELTSAEFFFGHFNHNSNTLIPGMEDSGPQLFCRELRYCNCWTSRRHRRSWQLDWVSLGKVWASVSTFFLVHYAFVFRGGFFLYFMPEFLFHIPNLSPY